MPRTNVFSTAVFWSVVVLLLTVGGWLGLEANLKSRQEKLVASHQAALAAREKEWARQELDRQLDAHAATKARRSRHHDEFLAALGGSVGAAVKDPDLTLTGMLEQLALACAPPGSRVDARAERFTEFKVFIVLPRKEEGRVLNEAARCLLAHGAEYVHRLQFSHGDSLIAELDRRAIESVTNWGAVAAADVDRLWLKPENVEPVTFVAAVKPAPEPELDEPQNVPEEIQKQKAAEERFADAFRLATRQLNTAVELQETAVNVAGVKSVREIELRRQNLADADAAAAQARRVLTNPVSEYERILQERKLDPVYIRAASRTAGQSHERSRFAATKIFDALAQRSRAVNDYLDVMKRHFGAWTFRTFEDRFEFDNELVEQDYRAATRKIGKASQQLNAALAAWRSELEKMDSPSQPEGAGRRSGTSPGK